MNVNKMRILLLWCLAFFVLACNKDKVEGFSDGSGEETSALSFVLKTDYSLNEVALTRAGVVPPDADFKVRIENTRAEVLKSWDYGSLPSLIKVVPGSYKLVAWYGNDSILPAFESPYYYGELKVTLKEGDNLDTIVKSTNAAVKVAVKFDESFGYEYDDYWVDIKTVGDSLSFAKDEKREAFFKPGKLRMRFVLKPKGKNEYLQFYPDPIASVKAKEFYNMTLKAQTKNGALSGITIATDSSTIEIPVNVELPPFYLPKEPPVVSLKGVASGDVIETTEGVSKPATVMIASSAGLTELKIKTVSDTLIARGWPKEIDLMKATDAQKAILKLNGLEWSDEINIKDTIKTTVWVRFNNVIQLLNTPPNQIASTSFEVNVKDRFDQVAATECKFDVKVAPPVFGFKDGVPVEGNMWARKAIFDLVYSADREGYFPTVQYKTSEGTWRDAEEVTGAEGISRARVNGLNSLATYVFRARLREHILSEYTLTTEAELQIPNAGFEEYYSEKVWEKTPMGGQKINAFYPYLQTTSESDRWWNTRNRTTTQPLADYSWYYAAYSGTVPTNEISQTASNHLNRYGGKSLTINAHGGNTAMEIASIGWGKNNWTSQSSAQSGCKMRTAGALYIGNYNLSTHTEEYGHLFNSRPSVISFFYKFYSYNGESTKAYALLKDSEGNQIGYGELKITTATDVYQNGKIMLHYTRGEKAASIVIVFLSTDAEQPSTLAIQGNSGLFGGYGDARHIGSILTVDDVELIYE